MKNLIFITVVLLIIVSCDKTNDQKRFESLKVGMTADQVVDLAGEPTEKTILGWSKNGGDTVEVWYYYFQDEIMQEIQFIDRNVSGIILDYNAEQKKIKDLMDKRKPNNE